MIVGCYDLHLYCDAPDCTRPHPHSRLPYQWPQEFNGRNLSECMRKARALGWSFKGDKATCPHCNKKKLLAIAEEIAAEKKKAARR